MDDTTKGKNIGFDSTGGEMVNERKCEKGHTYWVLDWTPETPEADIPGCPLCNHDWKSGRYPIPYVVKQKRITATKDANPLYLDPRPGLVRDDVLSEAHYVPPELAVRGRDEQLEYWRNYWIKTNNALVKCRKKRNKWRERFTQTYKQLIEANEKIDALVKAGDLMIPRLSHHEKCAWWTSTPNTCTCGWGGYVESWLRAQER